MRMTVWDWTKDAVAWAALGLLSVMGTGAVFVLAVILYAAAMKAGEIPEMLRQGREAHQARETACLTSPSRALVKTSKGWACVDGVIAQ